jgi:hypothetical protein
MACLAADPMQRPPTMARVLRMVSGVESARPGR